MTLPTEPDPEDLRIVDDSPIEAARYRIGAVFDLYHDGTSVKFRSMPLNPNRCCISW